MDNESKCDSCAVPPVVDAAFGQEVITVNEFRELLGLKRILSGDVTIKGRKIENAWLSKAPK